MTRPQAFAKANVHLNLLAEGAGRRDLMATLDRLYRTVVTDANYDSLLVQYKQVAAALSGSRSFNAVTVRSLLECRARQDDEPDDDTEDYEDGENDEERAECRCIQRQWAAFTTRALHVTRCQECRDGNHSACEYECGAPDSEAWLAEHADEADERNRQRLEETRLQIKRDQFRAGEISLSTYVEEE